VVSPDSPGILGPLDGKSSWWLHIIAVDGTPDVEAHIRGTVGRPVDFEVRSVSPWASYRLIASVYRDGRVLVLGDASHLRAADGRLRHEHRVGRRGRHRLAAVLRGWAPPELLDGYQHERRPVHGLVIDQAVHNYRTLAASLSDPRIEDPAAADLRARIGVEVVRAEDREFRSKGLQLGYRYTSHQVVPDATEPPPPDVTTRTPTARPGHRLPHAWLDPTTALFDRLGHGFTLLVADGADPGPFDSAGVPLSVVHLDGPQCREVLGADFVLVRPDQHVAWRGDALPAALFERVRGG
jgi:hypothetical protein